MTTNTIDQLTERILERLGNLNTDGHWHIGQIISEVIEESKAKSQIADICRQIATHPKANFSYEYLRQCIRTYTYYPEISSKKLPEPIYHLLANRIYHKDDRERFEQLALNNNWNVNRLAKEIRKERLSSKENQKSELGFDLQLTNLWYFNTADPRFGKPDFRGRIAGQIIANALYYFASDDGAIVDPFAGSGTLGDVIDKLPYFSGRNYIMLDLNPSDERIKPNDVTVHGIPLPKHSANYIFLDPPYGHLGQRHYGSSESDLSQMSSDAFLVAMYSVIRECKRILEPGKNVSIIIEPILPFDDNVIDLPFLLGKNFIEEGFETISKVYVPSQIMRNKSLPNIFARARAKKRLISDCRELLTFRKT
jgi:hypothetical protein